VKVSIPSPLRSYTGADEVEADGATVAALLADLDARHPGIRFRMIDEQGRIRPHMRIFLNGERIAGIEQPVSPGDRVQILQALSGG
jgi:molybdopterin synthase sulfur carrier subunit